MNNVGVTPISLRQKWQFGVEIDGFLSMYFKRSDLPKMNFEKVEFAPGGSIWNFKAAGRAEFPDISMEKGQPQEDLDSSILDWMNQCVAVAAHSGGVPSDYMRQASVVEFDREGNEIRRWNLKNAWIAEADWGEGDGESSDYNLESITICYDFFTVGAA